MILMRNNKKINRAYNVLGDDMNHKILLTLFLFFVVIFSSTIISINNDKIVEVKKVVSNVDSYTIGSINEESNGIKINIYYPVTKYENVNLEIMQEIQKYISIVKESSYTSNNKFLKISFEDYTNDNMIGFEFNVEYNEGLYHDKKESFKIEYCEDEN